MKKSEDKTFAFIPHFIVASRAYQTLPASALRMLSIALTKVRKNNNGDISLTRSQLIAYGFTSSDTRNRAIKLLLDHGLLFKTNEGFFSMGAKKPCLYAITWIPIKTQKNLDNPDMPAKLWLTKMENWPD